MKNKRVKITIIITAICFTVILFSSIIFYFKNTDINVSQEEFKKYIEGYLLKYKQLVENNIPAENRSEFKFYKNYPYEVKGIFSTSHGAAIFFNHSSTLKITIDTIDERIEFYMWPQMKEWWNNASTNFVIEKNETVIFTEKAGDNPITINRGGRITIFGTVIYENKMRLKGCNEKEHWSEESAKLDALSDFLRVARGIIKNKAGLTEIEGINKLIILAEDIAEKERKGLYINNPELLAKDNKEYFELAEKFGIESQIAENIKENELEKYLSPPEPPLYHNPWFVTIIGGLIVTIIVAIFRYIKKIKK